MNTQFLSTVYHSLYDFSDSTKDNLAESIEQSLKDDVIAKLVYTEKTSVRACDSFLFPLSYYRTASKLLIANADLSGLTVGELVNFLRDFWGQVSKSCDWLSLTDTNKEKRLDQVTALPYVLNAIGEAGGLCQVQFGTIEPLMAALKSAEWKRKTKLWFSLAFLIRDDLELSVRFIRLKLLMLANCQMAKEDLLAYQMLSGFEEVWSNLMANMPEVEQLAINRAKKTRIPTPELSN